MDPKPEIELIPCPYCRGNGCIHCNWEGEMEVIKEKETE